MTNKALCELTLQKYDQVIKTTDRVLSLDPNNAKAIYRNALASKKLGDILKQKDSQNLKEMNVYYENARKELERLIKIEPKNEAVLKELNEIRKICIDIKLELRNYESEATERKI